MALSNKATDSTAVCPLTNLGDPNLNNTHNWIISGDTSCLELRIAQYLSFLQPSTVPRQYIINMTFFTEKKTKTKTEQNLQRDIPEFLTYGLIFDSSSPIPVDRDHCQLM